MHGDKILALCIDPASRTPIYRQVYHGVRRAIVAGMIQTGARLPSTRSLSADLGISRNTVVMAYEQLRSEGYVVGRGGSDTRVAPCVPDLVMRSGLTKVTQNPGIARISTRARRTVRAWEGMGLRLERPPRAFRAGVPATDLFPYTLWGRLLSRRWSRITARDLGYANPQGFLPLREAIASYVAGARGVQCSADQVFLAGGAQGALDVAAKLVLDPGDEVWMEDPGYHGARGAFLAAGAHVIPVPVDNYGLQVREGRRLAPNARAVFVTPSRQMPLGVSMSQPRRSELVAWARENRSWIIEDDYDSEIRFASRPLPAIHSNEGIGSVLYIGTFSKVLFPALRQGYLIVPNELVPAAMAMRHMHDGHSPILEQMVLADFMEGGHFERHVRRLRQVYLERQQCLNDAVGRYLSGVLSIPAVEVGLFVTAWLNGGSDVAAARAAASEGVDVVPVSCMAEGRIAPGLVLGYAGLNVADITEGARRLAKALRVTGRR